MSEFGKRIVARLGRFVEDLDSGEVKAKYTIRTVRAGLKPTRHNAKTVKAVRKNLGASQAVFAKFLGVSAQTVRAWEQGTNKPSGIACRFLDEMSADMPRWKKRLNETLTSIG